jgi:hypothetical protein
VRDGGILRGRGLWHHLQKGFMLILQETDIMKEPKSAWFPVSPCMRSLSKLPLWCHPPCGDVAEGLIGVEQMGPPELRLAAPRTAV